MDYSVVIPIYKRSELLLETLNSVSSQDLKPLEIIIVDNNDIKAERVLISILLNLIEIVGQLQEILALILQMVN